MCATAQYSPFCFAKFIKRNRTNTIAAIRRQVLAAVWIRHYSAAGRMGGDGYEVGVVFERLNQKSFGGVGAISFVSSGENCRRSASWTSVAYRDQI